jgi:hypothetical protein
MTGTSICHKFQKPEQISEMGVKIQEIPYENIHSPYRMKQESSKLF